MKKWAGRKWPWVLLGSALALITAFIIMKTEKAEHGVMTERPVMRAEVMTAAWEEISLDKEAPGVVAPLRESTLASKVLGLVREIRVREGDEVQAGDLLIRLDNRDLKARLDQARAELENAEVHLRRMRRLQEEDSVAQQVLDDAERAYKVALAAERAVRADLTYTLIKAPFAGVVTEKMIELGELAAPGRPLLKLEDRRPRRLEATVSETDISRLREGQRLTVRLDALPGRVLEGRVSQILPSADPSTHSFTVKVDLPAGSGIRSGLFGRMVFSAGTRRTILVPRTAVLQAGELAKVYALDEHGVAQLRLVKTGRAFEGRVEILSGLKPGERILVRAEARAQGALIRPAAGIPHE